MAAAWAAWAVAPVAAVAVWEVSPPEAEPVRLVVDEEKLDRLRFPANDKPPGVVSRTPITNHRRGRPRKGARKSLDNMANKEKLGRRNRGESPCCLYHSSGGTDIEKTPVAQM